MVLRVCLLVVVRMDGSPESITARSRLRIVGVLGRLGDLRFTGALGLSALGAARGLEVFGLSDVFHGRRLAMLNESWVWGAVGGEL